MMHGFCGVSFWFKRRYIVNLQIPMLKAISDIREATRSGIQRLAKFFSLFVKVLAEPKKGLESSVLTVC